MASVPLAGLPSVLDRTLFTNKGPIVKPKELLLTGIDLIITSETEISIKSGFFTNNDLERLITISGSFGGRNDGTFPIKEVKSSTQLVLDGASFDLTDVAETTKTIAILANDLRVQYELHRVQTDVHGINDTVNIVTVPGSIQELALACLLLNDIKIQFQAHIIDISGPPITDPVHLEIDTENTIYSNDAIDLASALILANELRKKYEAHRQNIAFHENADKTNYVRAPKAEAFIEVPSNLVVGPLPWTFEDPRIGRFADDPSDVTVTVNGSAAGVDAVFGLLGAVVLSAKPVHGDDVKIDYDWLNNPPVYIARLNSPEFNFNQEGLHGLSGFPAHRYRARAYLLDPLAYPALANGISTAIAPTTIGWRYKGLERAYLAGLNDPNLLRLNMPPNKILIPTDEQFIPEVSISYDPKTLPQNAPDPWTLEGTGNFSLSPAGNELTITDLQNQTGVNSKPPFFTHPIDVTFSSIVSAAFRAKVKSYVPDGVYTGVGFGVSDGQRVGLIGFIQTRAINLSSAIVLTNNLKARFNDHIVKTGIHIVNDPSDKIIFNDATNQPQLVILLNDLKAKYNTHIAKVPTHTVADTENIVVSPDAGDIFSPEIELTQIITLVNEIFEKFNLHRTQDILSVSVHNSKDLFNVVNFVKQVGILTNRGPEEFELNWNAYALDWKILKSYRIHRDSIGNISVYLSGIADAICSAQVQELPAIADLDGKFDPVQQVFFGSTSRIAKNVSNWAFTRTIISPLNPDFIGRNKSVDYEGLTIPELDPVAPWIVLGQGGIERVIADQLLVDSTCSAITQDLSPLGMSSGAFRGFMRFEPIQTSQTSTVLEFGGQVEYYTFSVDDRSVGAFIDDKSLQTHLAFIQYQPSSAIADGNRIQPFPIITGDTLTIGVNGGVPVTVSFLFTDTTAALIATKINNSPGLPINLASDNGGKLRLTSPTLGANSVVKIYGGTAVAKLGLIIGDYIGRDSNPEPRISYFGANLPDLDTPTWTQAGGQIPEMLGRILQITDEGPSDFLLYTVTDPVVTIPVLSPTNSYKVDARLKVNSFTRSNTIISTFPFVDVYFAGAFVNVDEGVVGKQFEVQLTVDANNIKYVTIVSYSGFTSNFKIVFQTAFDWFDEGIHTYNVFVNKAAGLCTVLIDGVSYGTFLYAILESGLSPDPSFTFGSGSNPIGFTDTFTSLSVVEWYSICSFKDSKIADPSSVNRRYIGLYRGGDPTVLSSYFLHQIDWSIYHTYKIVRDPVDSVTVYIDNNPVPVITTSYDNLRLPPANLSFLNQISQNLPIVAFGNLNPQEISRVRWDFVKYSIGKIIMNDRLAPRHHLFNYANPISSPDHLFTTKVHAHAGREIYSNGTPDEELLADSSIQSYTVLGPGTPPVPMTQNLESRGGLQKVITQTKTIDALNFVNANGFYSSFNDDLFNSITQPVAFDLTSAINLTNNIKEEFNLHLSQYRVHVNNDVINVITMADAIDLASAISLVNDIKAKYNFHRIQATIHTNDDTINIVLSIDAVDLPTLITLVNEIRAKYESHRVPIVSFANDLKLKINAHFVQAGVHVTNDLFNTITHPDAVDQLSSWDLLNAIKASINNHYTESGVHIVNDFIDTIIGDDATEFASALLLANEIKIKYDLHRVNLAYHPIADVINIVTSFISLFLIQDVHDSTVIIRLDPPDRVLYNAMKFYQFPDGNFGLLSPFSDDETLHIDGFKYAGIHSFFYDGSVLPEDATALAVATLANNIKAEYNAHRIQLGIHWMNDAVNVVTAPNATDLATAITLINDIKAQFNIHTVSVPIHLIPDPNDMIRNADATEIKTALALVNEIRDRYSAHIATPTFTIHLILDDINKVTEPYAPPVANPGWIREDIGPGPVFTGLITSGPTDALRYGTPGPAETVYKYNLGLPDTSYQNFEVTASLRINSYTFAPTFDSRMYAGFLSNMGQGVSAAIGFDAINSIPYVKIHDVNSDTTLWRAPFNWADGNFHTFKLVRDVATNSIGLILVS